MAGKDRCICDEWTMHIDSVDACLIFCNTRFAAPKFDGPMFIYCPWCGEKLKEIADANIN